MRRIIGICGSALTAAIAMTLGTGLSQPAFDWAEFLTPLDHVGRTIDIMSDPVGDAVIAFVHLAEGGGGNSVLSNVVAKVSARGEFLWSSRGLPSIRALASDAEGSVYVAGTRSGSLGEPIPANYFARVGITPDGDGTAYIAKLSSKGVLQWVRQFGGSSSTLANAVVFDREGNYYVGGQYKAGTVIGDRLLPAPSSDWGVYVAKFAPDGKPLWSRTGSGSGPGLNLLYRVVLSSGFKLDRQGNLNVRLEKWAPYFDESGLVGNGAYFARFAPDGRLLLSIPTPEEAPGASDADGNLFTAQFVKVDAPHPAGILRVRKYAATGELIWMREATVNKDSNFDYGVVADSAGNCIVGGSFPMGNVDQTSQAIDLGQVTFGNVTLTTIGFSDGFTAKYSSAGDLRWAVQSKGQSPIYFGYQYPNDISGVYRFLIAPSPGGDILFAGALVGPVAFGEILLEGPTSFFMRQPAFVGRLVEKSEADFALSISRQANDIVLSWPGTETGVDVETSSSLLNSTWTAVADQPVIENGHNLLRLEFDGATRFFRLRRP